jgi:hypothetical protein
MLKYGRHRAPVALLLAGTAMVTMTADASAATFPTEKRYLSKPLHICDQGSFFVGGVPKVTAYAGTVEQSDPRQITIGQMYVQFQIPMWQRGWPLIHVHGSTHTGAALESTPDGREGWLPYGVRNGIASYVVDQSGRGRSGFDHTVIHEGARTGNLDLIPTFGRITDNAAWTNWFGHLIPEGSTILDGELIRHGDPGDPPDDDDRHPDTYFPAYPIPPVPNSVDPDIEAREGALGPDVNPANNTYLALEYYKQLVPNGEATLPGSICPSCEPSEVTPQNTWTPRNLATLVEGLGGAIVATHSQSGNMGHHMARILKERGSLHLLKALVTIEGGCDLPGAGLAGSDFDDIPYLAVSGDYRSDEQEQTCVDAVAEINASPSRSAPPAEFLELDEIGNPDFDGTTHMMMLGTNNIEVFDAILEWVEDNVGDQPGRMTCAADEPSGWHEPDGGWRK